MSLILNLIWLVFGGLVMALGWLLATVLAFLSIVGIPWGRACWTITKFTLWPFGKEAISRRELSGEEDLGTGALGTVGNIVWLLLAGIWLAIGHVAVAIPTALTIIGIPLAWQHLKLAAISLWPVGQTVVDKEVAAAARQRNAMRQVENARLETRGP